MSNLESPTLPVAVDTNVFEGAPEEAMFWIGKTSHNGEILMPAEEGAAHQLCAETYHSVGIMAAAELATREIGSGGNTEDSEETSRFVVLSRGLYGTPSSVIATMKTIHRPSLNHPPLPIEGMFPETFAKNNRSAGNLEISRTASRNPDGTIQNLAFVALIRASFIEATTLGSTEIYCATEEFVEVVVKDLGIPYIALSSPTPFQEMRSGPTMLVPLLFSVTEILSLYDSGDLGPIITAYLAGTENHRGLGFFGPDLINPLVQVD